MTAVEAYTEALRRIEESQKTQCLALDLGDLPLAELPEQLGALEHLRVLALGKRRPVIQVVDVREWWYQSHRPFQCFTEIKVLSGLRNLRQLDLSYCVELANLDPIAGLTEITHLSLYACDHVIDLEPLQQLTKLQELTLGKCKGITDLTPIGNAPRLHYLALWASAVQDLSPISNLPNLQTLYIQDSSVRVLPETLLLHGKLEHLAANTLDDCPREIQSEDPDDSCLLRLRSWWTDLMAGEELDREVKVFMLGNACAGKTQICRCIFGQSYDDTVPSTHGVQIGHFDILQDAGAGATKAKLWDFGGQDIYHGTHALFMEGRAVFILVWSRDVEGAGDYEESDLSMHHHRLVYWLDYVHSLAGENAAVIVVQAKCDLESDRVAAPLPMGTAFKRPLPQVTCSAKLNEMDELKAAIRSATRYLLEVHGTYRLPSSWVVVRDRLRELKLTEKTIPRERFEELCHATHGTSVPGALLNYLHRCGELFYREGLFRDEIVLDQEWAVRAVYAVLDRDGPCQKLRKHGGIFTLPLLSSLVWHDGFTELEQEAVLDMMASCAICFPLDREHHDRLRRYAVPDLLPLEAEVTVRMEALWRSDLPGQKVTLEYAFLHAGILRRFLCQIGRLGGHDVAYWRYGCCFYDSTTRSRARIRAESIGSAEAPARGRIVIETCEGNARELLVRLQQAITKISIGQPPQVIEQSDTPAEAVPTREEPKPLAETLKIVPAPTERPLIYLSYAWGGAKEELVDRLEARLIREGYEVKRDKRSMRTGDWISDFMREIGQAKCVCVVLSEKYVQSPYCMRELLYLYQSSCSEKEVFLNRIVPLVLEDAKLSTTSDRLAYVRYWNAKLQCLKDDVAGLDPATWGGAPSDMTLIQDFCHHIELMLRHVSDHLMPRGITDIEKNDFATVLAALKAKT